ncbi:unnamed protein product [Effrenium voratum]|nr:unnamed protein product [Effrenium voratum]
MLPLVLLPWLAAASPQLIRKHPPHHVLSVAAHGDLNEERAPTGHKYRHLAGLSAAFEEMKAITKRAEDVASTSTDECAGAGAECKKVVDFLGDKLPVEKDEKLQFLCAPAALDCLSANMDKCRAVHEQLSALQHRWQCEAVKCSKSGPDCSMTVLYLEMDDHQLSEDQRNRKTRFLCSNQAKKCVSDHKDVCKTAYDIVSVANDLGHCDRSRCSDVSIDCSMAVTYLTEDHISNVTFKASTAKWTYLCEDAAFSCLEKNMEVCGRYYNALKLAFAEGHCNSARCAKEGPDCATAVKYLSEPDKQYSEQELQAKNDFLCSDKAVACIGSHPTCSEFHLPAKAAFESTKCPVTLRSESAAKQGPAPEEPKVDTKLAAEADPQLTAQKAAEIAYSKKQEKEKADKEKQILAFAAKQKNAGAEEELEATKKAKAEEAAEAKKKGLTILAGAVVVLVALVGGTVWYIRRRAEKGKPPKPKKPGLLKKLKNPLKNPLKKSAGLPQQLEGIYQAPVVKTYTDSALDSQGARKARVAEHLQELAKGSEHLCLWLDADREGENIGFEVIAVCKEWFPDNSRVHRAIFSALTQEEVCSSFESLGKPDADVAKGVDARQELDLRVGISFSRLLTRKLRDETKAQSVTYGPCQTPALGFCVARHGEIEGFQPRKVWTPRVEASGLEFAWAGESTESQEEATKIRAALSRSSEAPLQLEQREERVPRPVGLNTVQLLRSASNALNLGPKQAMKLAEDLYSKGLISYPRTETTRYHETFDASVPLRAQQRSTRWGRSAAKALGAWKALSQVQSRRARDVGDHPPIVPLRLPQRGELRGQENKLYDFVSQHFVASWLGDARLRRHEAGKTFALRRRDVEAPGLGLDPRRRQINGHQKKTRRS